MTGLKVVALGVSSYKKSGEVSVSEIVGGAKRSVVSILSISSMALKGWKS